MSGLLSKRKVFPCRSADMEVLGDGLWRLLQCNLETTNNKISSKGKQKENQEEIHMCRTQLKRLGRLIGLLAFTTLTCQLVHGVQNPPGCNSVGATVLIDEWQDVDGDGVLNKNNPDLPVTAQEKFVGEKLLITVT